MAHTIPVQRGCGTRQEGGIYAECGMGADGKPLEEFLFDPPIPIHPPSLGLSPVGVILVDDPDGVTHVMDWVGSEHYPNVADFLEEVRRYGLSRRLPRTLQFERLTADSRLILVHSRGFIRNFRHYYPESQHTCPKGHEHHVIDRRMPEATTVPVEMCAGLWWEDVDPRNQMSRLDYQVTLGLGERAITRQMPSFSYECRMPPVGLAPSYTPTMIASFPLTNLAVIRGQSGEHEQALAAVKRAKIGHSLDDA